MWSTLNLARPTPFINGLNVIEEVLKQLHPYLLWNLHGHIFRKRIGTILLAFASCIEVNLHLYDKLNNNIICTSRRKHVSKHKKEGYSNKNGITLSMSIMINMCHQ